MVQVGHLTEDDSRALLLLDERIDAAPDGAAEDVVREQHDHALAADESLRQAQRLGDAARPILVRVQEALDAELLAVAEQAQELAGVGSPRDQHHLRDAALHERLDRVVDHGPVVDRQQVLVRDPR